MRFLKEELHGKLQVVVKSYTCIKDSETPFEIPDSVNDGATSTTLNNLSMTMRE